jgi:hypothetical protein
MNRNPMLPNWQLPRRRPFCARRGIALLRTWRLRFTEQPRKLYVQTEFAFGPVRSPSALTCKPGQASTDYSDRLGRGAFLHEQILFR